MPGSSNNGANDARRSTSPGGTGGQESVNEANGQPGNEQSPSGNPFPPPGFQGFYGYTPGDGAAGENGAPGFFGFQGAVYNNPMFNMQLGAMAAQGQFVPKAKRKQVKNACVNCASACKKCDNARPCERCKKYGITETCVDSARKERKKGVKRGPYKRRLKNGTLVSDDPDEEAIQHAGAGWLPAPDGQPTTVDPANLPNHPAGPAGSPGYGPPENFYTYPYPYPFPHPPPGPDGQPGPEGTFPPPHFFPHLHPAYPPYPPWGQPQPPFEVTGELPTGSARTTAKKKRTTASSNTTSSKKNNEELKEKRDATNAARASRLARRSGGTSSGVLGGNDNGTSHTDDGTVMDISSVTDPSLLAAERSDLDQDHDQLAGDHEETNGTVDPQATTT